MRRRPAWICLRVCSFRPGLSRARTGQIWSKTITLRQFLLRLLCCGLLLLASTGLPMTCRVLVHDRVFPVRVSRAGRTDIGRHFTTKSFAWYFVFACLLWLSANLRAKPTSETYVASLGLSEVGMSALAVLAGNALLA